MKALKSRILHAASFVVIGLLVGLGHSTAAMAAPADAVTPSVTSAAVATTQGAAVAGLPTPGEFKAQEIVVIRTSGSVERQSAGSSQWTAVANGDKLSPHDRIRTGVDGRARIEFDGKIRILILADSELTVEEAKHRDQVRHTLLNLESGKLRAQADHLDAESTFKVRTPTSVSAVRGTTFYLSVVRFAQGASGILTNLYVDEGNVDFSALEDALNHLSLLASNSASIGGDGSVTTPRQLTPEEREALIQEFEKALGELGGNPQTGIEFGALPGLPGGGILPDDGARRDAIELLIDSLIKLREEDPDQGTDDLTLEVEDPSLLEELKEIARLLSEGVDDSGSFEYDNISPESGFGLGIVSDARTEPLDEALASESSSEVLAKISELQAIRNAEKDQLRDDLVGILGDQIVRQTDAEMEQQFDAQTGKVFTDVHGNRVRTDQYIYHEPDSDTVDMVSLTLRTGEYQNGITSFRFVTQFNQSLPEGTVLRDLPWNDYLNVVTYADFAAHAGQEGSFQEQENGGWFGTPLFDQYVVHDSLGETEDAPWLYPVQFRAEFENPATDRVTLSENYTHPYEANFLDSEGARVGRWVQGMSWNRVTIHQAGGVSIDEIHSKWLIMPLLGITTITSINGQVTMGGDPDIAIGSQTSEVQTEGLMEPGAVAGAIDGWSPPAWAMHRFTDFSPELNAAYQEFPQTVYELNGIFLPIDNAGQLIYAPGFQIRGIRDFVQPNQLVNGGKYNLEAILSFGRREYNYETGSTFVEDFRIDALITPEIFAHYGSAGMSSLFPDRLDEQDEEYWYE